MTPTRPSRCKKQINHCKRAYFDIKDALLIVGYETVGAFFEKFATVECLAEELPDYVTIRMWVDESKAEVQEIRDAVYADRLDMFDKLDPLIDELRSTATKLSIVSPRIVTKENRRRENLVRNTRRFVITTAVAMIGIAVAVVIAFRAA